MLRALPHKNFSDGAKTFITGSGYNNPTYCDWLSKDTNGNPRRGETYNPYSSYMAEINAGRAVVVSSVGATLQTPSYNGWDDGHSMAGAGYFYVSDDMSPKYLIVHTTAVIDGKVYANLSALGSYAYFMVRN